jgi:hypothetical protein
MTLHMKHLGPPEGQLVELATYHLVAEAAAATPGLRLRARDHDGGQGDAVSLLFPSGTEVTVNRKGTTRILTGGGPSRPLVQHVARGLAISEAVDWILEAVGPPATETEQAEPGDTGLELLRDLLDAACTAEPRRPWRWSSAAPDSGTGPGPVVDRDLIGSLPALDDADRAPAVQVWVLLRAGEVVLAVDLVVRLRIS